MDIGINKIGDYIHYNHLDYIEYGIGTKEHPKNNISPSEALYKQKELIKNEALTIAKRNKGKVSKEEIENQLNFFRPFGNSNTNIGKWTDSDINKIEEAIWQQVMKKIKAPAGYDEATLSGFESGGKAFKKGARLDANLRGSMRNQLSENGTNKIESITNRLALMEKAFDSIKAQKGVKNLENNLYKLRQEWDIIDNILKDTGQKGNISMINSEKIGYSKTQYNNFISNLNKMWREFMSVTSNKITGDITEYYAIVCQEVINNCAEKSVDEVINYIQNSIGKKGVTNKSLGWVGNDRGTTTLQKKFFNLTGLGKDTIASHFINEGFNNFTGGDFQIKPVQDKVDLLIRLGEFEIPASMKHHMPDTGFNINLHSGKSIWSLTQEYGFFMNHYLNITAQSKGHKNAYNAATQPLVPLANEILKFTMGLKALVGGIYKTDYKLGSYRSGEAELFIVYDGNRYNVYFVDDIIEKVSYNINLYLEIKGIDKNKRWSNIWIPSSNNNNKNQQYTYAYSRISNLLQELHEDQLKIALNPLVLK